MNQEKKKHKPIKSIALIIGVIVAIAVAAIAYLVVVDLKQEDILKKELVNLSNKDLLKDDFSIEVVTTGDYAYIEEAVKKFYKDLSDSVKTINEYLNDEDLINILSAENLQTDGPNFKKSYKIVEDTRTKSTKAIETIASLCEEETIKNLIDKEKVDEYSYDLYLQLMYTEDDLKTFAETKQEMETLSTNLNHFLDKVNQMLNMLERNSGAWEIADGQLYFNTGDLVNEYNTMYNELNEIAELFETEEQSTDDKVNSKI